MNRDDLIMIKINISGLVIGLLFIYFGMFSYLNNILKDANVGIFIASLVACFLFYLHYCEGIILGRKLK